MELLPELRSENGRWRGMSIGWAIAALLHGLLFAVCCSYFSKRKDGGENADKIKEIDPKEWQGRYCIECVYSPHCTGAGVMKNACSGFEPVVRKGERWWRR